MTPRVAFLGPAGTFSEEALRAARDAPWQPLAVGSLRDAVVAVREREADLAFVPIENALEGSVDQTLDVLAELAPAVTITGEHVHPIRTCLIARAPTALDGIEMVLSHPQPLGQCARFLRAELPGAATRASASTAEAVREVAASGAPWAALASRAAAEHHGCAVLREGVDDDPANRTRFVWVARAGAASAVPDSRDAPAVPDAAWRTSIAFAGPGDATPGWLVTCLRAFSDRGVNLTRIESRPLRTRLGHYRFFADVRGRAGTGGDVDAALEALAGPCDDVRVLGSYPAAAARDR